jgi:hypothetical protein
MLAQELRPVTKEQVTKEWITLRSLPLEECKFNRRIGCRLNDYYTFAARLNCRTKAGLTFEEWVQQYKDKPYVQRVVKFWEGRKTTNQALYCAFQLYSCSGAINAFKPIVARWVCLKYRPTTILDFSAGWGGRALGAISANVGYIGYDTNLDLVEPYRQMFAECKGEKPAKVIFEDSSKADFSAHTYDMIFTSPPYFIKGSSAQELYPHMPSYTSREQFNREFFVPVLKKAWAGLSPGGWCLLNLPVKMAETAKEVLGDWVETIPLCLYNRGKEGAYDELIYCWRKSRNLPAATFVNEWVEVRKSSIPGTDMWGLFAKRDIPNKTAIAGYQGEEMTLRKFKERYGQDLQYVYSLRPINKHLCGKEMPYLTNNPSHYANEGSETQINIGFKRRHLVALRDIKQGEEMFLKYMRDYPRDYVLENQAS